MPRGTIEALVQKSATNRFGYIRPDGEGDERVWFHAERCAPGVYDALRNGSRVEFQVERSDRGPRALNVTLEGAGAPAHPSPAPVRDPGLSAQRTETEPAEFINPFTFVRLLPEPRTSPGGAPSLLDRLAGPPFDRYVGLTGCIHCGIETATEVFVADSHGVGRDRLNPKKEHRTYSFFHRPDGRPAVPGSSLRGVVRSVFEAATNSCMIHVETDRRLAYHIDRRPVTHPFSVAEMIPEHLHGCTRFDALCPACRVFGWVARTAESQDRAPAYRGRVRFGDAVFHPRDIVRPAGKVTLRILSAPKPSYTWFYLLGDDGAPLRGVGIEGGHRPGSRIQGRKMYWYQDEVPDLGGGAPRPAATDQNRSIRDWLRPGAEANFRIYFENLAPVELGALLWSLEMEGEQIHRVGYGKPLGLGSVWTWVRGLSFAVTDRYREEGKAWDSLRGDGLQERAEELKAEFRRELVARYGGASFQALPNIADLLAALDPVVPGAPVCYPRMRGVRNPKGYEWFQANANGRRLVVRPAAESPRLPTDPR